MVDKMPEAYRITSTKILDWMPLGVIMQTPRPLLMDSVDVAVIGSGIAGLFLAVRCAKAGLKVAVITKKEFPLHLRIGHREELQEYWILRTKNL